MIEIKVIEKFGDCKELCRYSTPSHPRVGETIAISSGKNTPTVLYTVERVVHIANRDSTPSVVCYVVYTYPNTK